MTIESVLEKKICQLIQDIGGVTFKFTSPSTRGVPDRVAMFASCGTIFIEVKTPTGRLSHTQERVIETIREHGGVVWVVSSLTEFNDNYQQTIKGL